MKRIAITVFFFLIAGFIFAKEKYSDFNVSHPELIVYSESVDTLYEWFEKGFPNDNVSSLMCIPANQFMEQLFRKNEKDAPSFKDVLLNFSNKHSFPDDPYLLKEAYTKRHQLIRLKKTLQDSLNERQIMEDVIEYFPTDFKPSAQYPVYFTLTGWKWGDAMSFSYIKDGNTYVLADTGIPAMIFNLTIINSTYGDTQEKQEATFRKVLSHELFHALLEDYIADKDYYDPNRIEAEALFLLMNEGIAHFIADGGNIHSKYESLKEKERILFSKFSEKAKIIFDRNEKPEVRTNTLEEGLYGPYWEKYVSTTGLFMAYHINRYGGRELVKECIKKGPVYFVEKYRELCLIDKELPLFPISLVADSTLSNCRSTEKLLIPGK